MAMTSLPAVLDGWHAPPATAPPTEQSPYSVLLRLDLALLTTHFNSEWTATNQNQLLDYDKRILKRVLTATVKDPEARNGLGTDPKFWQDMATLFKAATPSLHDKCFAPKVNETSNEYDAASSKRIVLNHSKLQKDLPRIQDLVGIARNVLTIGQTAQNLAAEQGFGAVMFDLITLCIKITARGFTSEGSSQDEEKWQSVIDEFKKLLVKCLQFINNLTVQNERRKLMLWIELFDSTADGLLSIGEAEKDFSRDRTLPTSSGRDPSIPSSSALPATPGAQDTTSHGTNFTPGLITDPFQLYYGALRLDVQKEMEESGLPASEGDVLAECQRRWEESPDVLDPESTSSGQMNNARDMQGAHNPVRAPSNFDLKNASVEELRAVMARQTLVHNNSTTETDGSRTEVASLKTLDGTTAPGTPQGRPIDHPIVKAKNGDLHMPASSSTPTMAQAEEVDFRMVHTADYGLDILEQGKTELLKRLEPDTEKKRTQNIAENKGKAPAAPETPASEAPTATPTAPKDRTDAASEEGDSSEEEYDAIPGDNNRGLLTDVPLILGPTEVEVLPMIIQSAIVAPLDRNTPGYGTTPTEIAAIKNMHIVRCHLLLAQDNGRNLLRELLIFVAAWDLREDELYFKLMASILEAILLNGLMPFAYQAFQESKDIVSPAQSVIMKLLTGIFRSRQLAAVQNPNSTYPFKVEAHMVHFILTEFRKSIIPQTCALIFLQGKIRHGHAGPDDFPLNLWDMERMYEGIYQYLEMLAILTEHAVWKHMLTSWNLACELVSLVEELDAAIPRSTPASRQALDTYQAAVEQPSGEEPAGAARNLTPQTSIPPLHVADNYPMGPSEEEPSNFEWRNLKKLAVLVLSSLVWHNAAVKAQLGAPDSAGRPGRGIRALLNCCKHDDFNPYVREHAVMALRFALEECPENQEIVRALQPQDDKTAGDTPVMNDAQAGASHHSASHQSASASNEGLRTESGKKGVWEAKDGVEYKYMLGKQTPL
ncbi:hypothetical protein BT63DRAFT_424355 [Microthyrium microscopicum]|uniref:Ataxin-10 homolog n=1 Tax=Microthyrium microscopicum TaxID=703497 RepID=A0A6A6UFS7_9PEZI|nr:hypothetical protein BT63DRAFT_424355 [Microthyrium microscopicum]